MHLDHRLLPSGEAVILVAFSGGPDSTTLLHLLRSGGYKVHAAHINHNLRGEEADADAAYCAAFCRQRSIPFTLIPVDVKAERERSGGGMQETARRLRYAALEQCASEAGAEWIATGHNRDDNAETILLNILRGSGTDGLRGIPESRGRIIRPLLRTSRAEIEAYCAEHGLAPRRDSSNDSTKYARNELRHTLMPYLREHFNPAVADALIRLSTIAHDESEMLDQLAAQWLQSAAVIEATALAREPAALRRRVIRLWLAKIDNLQDVGFEAVETICSSLGSTFSSTLPGNVLIKGDSNWVWRVAPAQRRESSQTQRPAEIQVQVPGFVDFGGWSVVAEGSVAGDFPLVVRSWQAGDRMRFHYGRKKLKRLFQEARMPMQLRWTIPLLVDPDSGEVLAIANGRVSDLMPDLRFTAERTEPTAS